jgi:hypothetical protein
MATHNTTRLSRRLHIDPGASTSSLVVCSAVPVVTPLSSHSQTLTKDVLEKVRDVLDKWKASRGKQNHLMDWLEKENRNMDGGWLQNEAFVLECKKGVPSTTKEQMWLFCIYLLMSGMFRGEGTPAEELGKAYGIGEQIV